MSTEPTRATAASIERGRQIAESMMDDATVAYRRRLAEERSETTHAPAVEPVEPPAGPERGTGEAGPETSAQAAVMIPADLIESNPGIRGGEPCMKGTRVPAADVAGLLADGLPWGQVHEYFPSVPLPPWEGCSSMVACGCRPDVGGAAKAATLRDASASIHAIADHMPGKHPEFVRGVRYAATLLGHTADDLGAGDA